MCLLLEFLLLLFRSLKKENIKITWLAAPLCPSKLYNRKVKLCALSCCTIALIVVSILNIWQTTKSPQAPVKSALQSGCVALAVPHLQPELFPKCRNSVQPELFSKCRNSVHPELFVKCRNSVQPELFPKWRNSVQPELFPSVGILYSQSCFPNVGVLYSQSCFPNLGILCSQSCQVPTCPWELDTSWQTDPPGVLGRSCVWSRSWRSFPFPGTVVPPCLF